MSDSNPTYVNAWADMEESEASAEGHWWAPAEGFISFEPSDEVCPFCKGPLQAVRHRSPFGRIIKDREERRGGQTSVVVELLPASHAALVCGACDIVFTQPKEESSGSQDR